MSDILLDYTFKVSTSIPIPEANKSYLRQALIIVKPKDEETEKEIVKITNESQIATYTENEDAVQLLRGGLSSFYLLAIDELNISEHINEHLADFFSILISSDFNDNELEDINVGNFGGVIARTFYDEASAKTWNIKENYTGFFGLEENGAKNMCFAFGKLLSATRWNNQQYVQCPYSDNIIDLGAAESLFEDRISFVLTSQEYGNRLAFFAVGGFAIIAPYVIEELKIDMQSKALQFINLNNPQYTITEASLLEDEEQSVINSYIDQKYITDGTIIITLDEQNFIAKGTITIPLPTALWRIRVNLIQEV